MSEQFKFIKNDIDITPFYDRLSRHVKELIEEAEEADRAGNEFLLYSIQDNIEVFAKMLVPDIISVREWEMLCYKYLPDE